MIRTISALIGIMIASTAAAPAKTTRDYRASVIARAQVWRPTDVAAIDFKAGPSAKNGFALGDTITCTYLKRKLTGNTPKFECQIDEHDEIKVKYGGDNGEVYAEVLGTRLLWALGFDADRMYSVRVVCRGCPETMNGVAHDKNTTKGVAREKDTWTFDPAAVERKAPGRAFHPSSDWSWRDLDLVDESAGGATRAQVDALRLLAVFIQHSDSKPEQQRLVCLDEHEPKPAEKSKTPTPCAHPYMLINDLGVTFGRANRFNDGAVGSVNLVEWSKTPVWQNGQACVGNLPKSSTGTLDNPVISEEGRQFLADLLVQLSDAQLRDLFDSARVTLRLRDPRDVFSGFPTTDEWVEAFKAKRDQIVTRRCATS